jgi:hypothetical protein
MVTTNHPVPSNQSSRTVSPAGTYYIWQGSTSLKKRNMSTGDDSSFASGAYLRPVAVVSVTKE